MTGEKISTIPIRIKIKTMKKIISTSKAPAAIGPYSQAVELNNTLYISGQIPINPEIGKIVDGDISEQTEQVFKNIAAILEEAGYSFSDVVKSTCLLSDISDFKAMNEIYGKYYSANQPARAAFAVKALPMNALIEIETIAMKLPDIRPVSASLP
jgi:2-iminobutanoate/2-iminopropanoate deaminase